MYHKVKTKPYRVQFSARTRDSLSGDWGGGGGEFDTEKHIVSLENARDTDILMSVYLLPLDLYNLPWFGF